MPKFNRLQCLRVGLAVLFAFGAQLCLQAAETADKNLPMKVMTFNLRYASDTPPNAWGQRLPVMVACLEKSDPDLIGTQEGLYRQLKDLERELPQYAWIGLGRDGGSKGEFMAVFYKKSRFEPVAFDHYWLSDTPDVVASTTWGNTNRRMVTWVRFKEKGSGREFYFQNTHLDHALQPAREKAAELILKKQADLDPALPTLLVGDFNAYAGRNKAYSILVGDGLYKDSWQTARERRGQVVYSFTGFQKITEGDGRIDWILHKGPIDVAWVEIDTFKQGDQWPSDHFPVVAEITLK